MKNLSSDELQKFLDDAEVISEIKTWCDGKTARQAWEQCQRGD
jgi:hypothetical protein